MRACVQRVKEARVTVGHECAAEEIVGEIARGLLVLVGVGREDTPEDARQLADKLVELRVFDDAEGKMNLSLSDVGGQMLIVSQFTLWGDCRKGRRPSYSGTAGPELAAELYERVVQCVRQRGIVVATGRFRAQMHVALVNDGPVTLLIDTQRTF